jgi:methyl-accepting chemotaxis protein
MVANNDPRTVLDKAADAVNSAAEAVQSTTESIAGVIEDSKRPGGVLDQVTRITREAPLRALALAFLVGWIAARRR